MSQAVMKLPGMSAAEVRFQAIRELGRGSFWDADLRSSYEIIRRKDLNASERASCPAGTAFLVKTGSSENWTHSLAMIFLSEHGEYLGNRQASSYGLSAYYPDPSLSRAKAIGIADKVIHRLAELSCT